MGSNPMGCKKIQALPCVCMVTHDKPCRQAVSRRSLSFFCRVSRLTHDKVSPCVHNLAVSKSRVHRERVFHVFFAVSNTGLAVCLHGDTRQTLPLGRLSPFVIFFCRVSRLTHDKVSPCVHNLTVSKSRVHRERVCHVFFAVSNTRQSLRRV